MDRTKQSTVKAPWEKLMDTSNEGILEILEQNAKWWEQAAVTCEQTAANHATGKKEEWELLSAVYRERAGRHLQLIEELRKSGNGMHSQASELNFRKSREL
jgi:hypothetical protein